MKKYLLIGAWHLEMLEHLNGKTQYLTKLMFGKKD